MATEGRRRFSADFKARVALEALRGDKTIQEIAVKHKVHPNQVSTWKRHYGVLPRRSSQQFLFVCPGRTLGG